MDCAHPAGEPCRPCARMRTRRWRHAQTDGQRKKIKEYDRNRRRAEKVSPSYERANARSYVRMYCARWGIKKKPCSGCSSPSASIHHPDPKKPTSFLWVCRVCLRDAARIKELVDAGVFEILARPLPPAQPPQQRPPVPAGVLARIAGGSGRVAEPKFAPLSANLYRAAEIQIGISLRQKRELQITTFAAYYLALLEPDDLEKVDAVGMSADLSDWRPYGDDMLDLSMINLYYRRRLAAHGRAQSGF